MSPLLAAVIAANTTGVIFFFDFFFLLTQCFTVQRLVAAHFVTTARFVTMVTKRVGIASIAASFVTNEMVKNRAGNVYP